MKRLLLILIFSSAIANCMAQALTTPIVESRPTVAVVLSGGGAKGVAHIAALRAIEDAGIPIDIICGTSMGSLIGALYCIGYSTDYLDSLVRAQDWVTLLSDRTSPSELTLRQREELNTYALIRGISSERPDRGGLIRGRNLGRLFQQLCRNYPDSINFDSLPIRFACVATDIVTNTEVHFHRGLLTTAMRASMAIPGVFTPVRIGDSVLVDGGLRNNFPADLAQQMGADIIIGVTVQNDMLTAEDIRDATDVLNQIIDLNTKNKYTDNLALSDVLIKVDVEGYSAGSFTASAIDTLLRRGAEEAERHRDDLQALAARIKGSTHTVATSPSTPSAPIGYEPSKSPTPQTTSSNRSSATASPTGRICSKPLVGVGFRFDTEDLGTLIINLKSPLPTPIPTGVAATLRLGQRLEAATQLTLLPQSFTSPTLGYAFKRNELDINAQGLRSYNIKYRQHTADFSPLNFRFRNFTVRAGLCWDYFDYYGRILTADTLSYPTADDHYFSYHFTADLNTEDHWYFPTRGTRLHLTYAYRTDNFIGIDNSTGISDLAFHWRINSSPASRFTLQPMLYGRLMFAEQVPLAFYNAIGGQWFGHFIEQQLPFPGVGGVELAPSLFGAFRLQTQLRILKNHYVLLSGAIALEGDTFAEFASSNPLLGAQLGYSYHTPLGPIDLRLGYSNLTSRLNLFISLGHRF